MNTQIIELDISKEISCEVVTLGQGDSGGTTIEAHIYDNGVRMINGTARFCMRLPNKRDYFAADAGAMKNGTVTYQVDESRACAVKGHTDECYFEITSGGKTSSTGRFAIDVLRAVEDGAKITPGWQNAVSQAVNTTAGAVAAANAAADNANSAAGAANDAVQLALDAQSDSISINQLITEAESGRVSAENARVAAESARNTAETARATAEDTRAASETARATAESGRVSEFATLKSQAGQATTAASEAASAANEAAESLLQAADNGDFDGVGIQSIEQTTTSTANGGTNVVTATLTDGTQSTFNIKNGAKGNTGTSLMVRGAWANNTKYYRDSTYIDVVTISGASYACKTSHTSSTSNQPPNSAYWTTIAARGSTGTAAGFGTPTANYIEDGGERKVTVSASGSNTAKVFNFEFHNMASRDFTDVDTVGGEACFPTFVRSSWSTSSDESTLPVTPCFVLDTSDMGLYWCDGE